MTTPDPLLTASEVARLAGVGRAAVGNWRRRHADFPLPAGGTETSPAFRRSDVEAWLRANGKIDDRVDAERLWQRLDAFGWSGRTASVLAGLGLVLMRGSAADDLRAWADWAHPDLAPALDDGVELDVVDLAPDALAVAEVEGGPTLFEQLCRRFLDARAAQVHATPPELAELMVALAGSDMQHVLDPACGTGSILMAAQRAGVAELFGQETEPATAMLARVRLTLAGGDVSLSEGNTLLLDAFPELSVHAVVTNPPFGLRDWQPDDGYADPRWIYGLPPRSESELAWVQHCLAHLAPEGDAVLLMPPGAAMRTAGRRIRAELVRQGRVHAVIALPPGSLPETGIAPLIWHLHGDEYANTDDGVIVVDTTRHVVNGRRIDWPAVRRVVEESLSDPDAAPAEVARRVSTIELLDDEVSLLPQRYLRTATVPAVDLGAARDRLLTLLNRAREAVPTVAESMPSTVLRWTPLGELARSGAVELLTGTPRLEIDDDGDGPAVLTARDVVAGRAPSGRLVSTLDTRLIRLRAGDVVLPLIAHRPVARVVEEEEGSVLGSNLFAVRARPEVLDPWYLAGVLQGEHVVRSSTTGSGSFRISPRSVEVPVAPLTEQEPLATAFRQLATLETSLARAADIGTELAATLRAGLVEGSLRPADETLHTPPARSTLKPRERNA